MPSDCGGVRLTVMAWGARLRRLLVSADVGDWFAVVDMIMFDFRLIDCPFCEVNDTTVRGLRGGAHHRFGHGIEVTVVECNRCKLLYANPFPFPKEGAVLYGDADQYFALHNEDTKVVHYRGLAQEMVQRSGVSEPRIVDVGCGRGEFVNACLLEGYKRVEGFDTSPAFVAYARNKYGDHFHEGTVEAFASGERLGSYDIVMLNAVLEHAHNPSSMLAACAQLLKPGGLIYIDIPNERYLLNGVANFLSRIRNRKTVYYLAPTWDPYHVFGFGKQTVRHILKQHGFELLSMQAVAAPVFKSSGGIRQQVFAFAVTQLNRISNLTDSAGNFTIFARKR